ncbi:MAG: PD40 domain-containing protein [Anaerolineales bacterium]|nr:PD40 domain-containing protein [Anaerolineales bacterium]
MKKLLVTFIVTLLLVGVPLNVLAAPEPAPLTSQSAQSGCSMDLMLVLDGSGSISPPDFEIMKQFVDLMLSQFTIGPRDANVGVIQFSTTASLYLGLTDDPDKAHASIANMTQFGESTNIAAAIDLAQDQFITRRAGIPRVIVVLTDGRHNESGNPVAQADIARAAGTAIFGIAVGDIDFNELIDISGGDQNVFLVSGFQGLNTILDILLNSTCAVVTIPQPGEEDVEVGTPLGEGTIEIRYEIPESGDTQIAFASNRDGDFEIYVMNADGTNVRQLTFNNVNDDKPSWSKDGTRIAWESEVDGDFEIFMMNADGTNIQQLTNNDVNDWGPAWNPTGTQIAFHSDEDGDIELFVMDADGNNRRQVTNNSGSTDRSPTWSPDGHELLYYSNEPGGRELYRINLDTGIKTRLSANEFYDGQPDWSLNGTGVIFGSTREDNNSEIYIMRLDGSNVVRLTNRPATEDDPVWSPDGRQVAFESDAAGNFDIWVMNADGTGLVQLTDSTATDWSPDWIWMPGTLNP